MVAGFHIKTETNADMHVNMPNTSQLQAPQENLPLRATGNDS